MWIPPVLSLLFQPAHSHTTIRRWYLLLCNRCKLTSITLNRFLELSGALFVLRCQKMFWKFVFWCKQRDFLGKFPSLTRKKQSCQERAHWRCNLLWVLNIQILKLHKNVFIVKLFGTVLLKMIPAENNVWTVIICHWIYEYFRIFRPFHKGKM